jgi:uncharacterized membrane protein YeaQ/YmgE (transglycosylase-associated protein family)
VSIIVWLAVGLISGFIASKVVNSGEEGLVMDFALGITGAIMGGFIFSHFFGVAGMIGFNFYSRFPAIGGAIAVLFIYRLASRRPNV